METKSLSNPRDWKYHRKVFKNLHVKIVADGKGFNHPSQGWIEDIGTADQRLVNNEPVECYYTESTEFYTTGAVGITILSKEKINNDSAMILLAN